MPDTATLIAILSAFLIGGFAKGVTGFGLPTVAVGLLTALVGLPQAVALMLVPALMTNVWQALAGGHTGELVRRIWPFLAAAAATIWIGVLVLARADTAWLTALLGLLLIAYGAVSLLGLKVRVPEPGERWIGVATGALNGVLTGMTGTFTVVGIMFLQGIGLARDALIQAMGMLFLVSSVALGIALGGNGLLPLEAAVGSMLALVPAFIGMAVGRRVRVYLSEAAFRRVFFVALILLGLWLVGNAGLR